MRLNYAWSNQAEYITDTADPNIHISIIIPVRNESKTIQKCIDSINNQSYPKDFFEVIIIDDFSEDGTIQVINDTYLEVKNIKTISLVEIEGQKGGKKNALTAGIKKASGVLIITIDADCFVGENWLSTIVSFYKKKQYKFIAGPVSFEGENTWFKKLQSVEFLSLIGSTGASIFIKRPIMCNGANLIYEKSLFNKINPFAIDKLASGDDVFFMLKVKELYGADAIGYLKSKEAIVFTSPLNKVKDFVSQRKRWASKSSNYKDFDALFVSLIVYFTNVLILLLFIASIFYNEYFIIALTCLACKSLVDYLFLKKISNFFGKEKYLNLFVIQQLLYMVYVVIIGIIASMGKYEWKGRSVK